MSCISVRVLSMYIYDEYCLPKKSKAPLWFRKIRFILIGCRETNVNYVWATVSLERVCVLYSNRPPKSSVFAIAQHIAYQCHAQDILIKGLKKIVAK